MTSLDASNVTVKASRSNWVLWNMKKVRSLDYVPRSHPISTSALHVRTISKHISALPDISIMKLNFTFSTSLVLLASALVSAIPSSFDEASSSMDLDAPATIFKRDACSNGVKVCCGNGSVGCSGSNCKACCGNCCKQVRGESLEQSTFSRAVVLTIV